MNKLSETITLDPDTINVIQDIERKTGKSFNAVVQELMREHLLATDQAFICAKCKKFLPIQEYLITNLSGLDYCKECGE